MRKLLLSLPLSLALSSVASAATPAAGVPLEVRRGFFTETDFGGMFTLGGRQGYSNFQVYLQLGVGYQFAIADGMGLIPIGFHVGIGANSRNCFDGRANVAANAPCAASDNFTFTHLSVSVGYLHRVVERLYLGGKIMGGYSLMDPPPLFSAYEGNRPAAGATSAPGGVNFGGALSLEYATNMDHFSVGLDIVWRFVLPSIQIIQPTARVQYTF